MDKRKKQLQEAWQSMESLVSPTPVEGPAMVEKAGLNIDELKSLLTVEDGDTDVHIKLGWKTIATISEDGGKWFPSIDGSEVSTFGLDTKEDAIKRVIGFFKEN